MFMCVDTQAKQKSSDFQDSFASCVKYMDSTQSR